ncbi:uncharacterized protein LOC128869828 [Anastrepha ludens]|uniref:uncharacterized protein LOC128869828 n=1 Tax=Anastrepha ludens TaxID=28586 RepID=UPI0023B1F65D|nr:uncharacterized protein LOC128869828 [Anastrepha ludens]
MMTKNSETAILLATAQIRVKAANGEYVTLRALIDQGSQKTTISEEAAQILHLPKRREVTELQGLGNTTVGVSKFKVNIEIRPRFLSNEVYNVEALILPKLASAQPDKTFKWDIEQWRNYTLADPNFNRSDRIDVVIGGDVYADILEEGIFKKDRILGQATKLGWILSGVLQQPRKNGRILAAVTTTLEKFWEIEDTTAPTYIEDDDECMKIFDKTTTRDENNRFVVNLPFKKKKDLGDSRKQAMARFLNLEKKLASDDNLRKQYVQFMRDYLEMGHMKKASGNNCGKYYLPHQAVIREGSLTTKLRVVFDASAKTTNGSSLNDILLIGPRLQKDIFDIITKWRQYVLTSDIEKMYRQIKVAESDQDYQRILWREAKEGPIGEYKLQTVTYGTASAPFLATRTLQEIAKSCEPYNYLLSNIIKNDFYMDDLMTGADSINECKIIQFEISKQLQKCGFHLRKWMSNNSEIITTIPTNSENEVIKIAEDETIKTLGIQWDPAKDMFGFNMNLSTEKLVTKRKALSDLARIFDPMGWLSPMTVLAKLFIQKLWLMKLNWDELLDENLAKEWQEFMQHVPAIKRIKIPRWFETKNDFKIELHGFADASEKAYAAVVYAKVGSVITIIAGKTKVNPIKNKKTLPKLELCTAHLLSKLLQRIKTVINREVKIFAWSDSSITLAWIKNSRSKDKFIKTRVEEIKLYASTAIWQHVRTKDNPADVASRVIFANKLVEHELWWRGPKWLQGEEHQWPTQNSVKIDAVYVATSKGSHF